MTDQALFEAFINSSPYPVFAKDEAHRWIYANIAFKALAGEGDIVGEDDSLVTHPSCLDRIRDAERRVLAGADSLDEETLITGTVLLTVRRPVTLPSGKTIIAGIVLSILDVADAASSHAKESIRKYEAVVARAGSRIQSACALLRNGWNLPGNQSRPPPRRPILIQPPAFVTGSALIWISAPR